MKFSSVLVARLEQKIDNKSNFPKWGDKLFCFFLQKKKNEVTEKTQLQKWGLRNSVMEEKNWKMDYEPQT